MSLIISFVSGCVSDQAQFVTPSEFSRTRIVRAKARELRAGDDLELSVEVNGKKEVPLTELALGYDGAVLVPLVGDVNLDAMTLAEARSELEKSYRRIYVATPLITLRMADDEVSGEWGYITVLGQVRNPGRFAVVSAAGMNLSDALHEAGGFGENANMRSVVVSRQGADGKPLQCECDITKLGHAGSGQIDLVLFEGDIVQVPERLF